MNPKKELEKHRLTCGPVTVGVEGVCRRKLVGKFNDLLDRLTIEVHPEGADPDLEDFESAENKEEPVQETLAQKRKRLIEEGKMQVDVKKAIREYEEKVLGKPKEEKEGDKEDEDGKEEAKNSEKDKKLMGNSKLLQDPTGKIEKR